MLLCGDSLEVLRGLDSESVQCCVTSPPYWGLRDYGAEGQLGLEKTPEEYAAKLVTVFAEVKRVLKKDGTLWLNIGDSYAGSWGAQSRGGAGDMNGRTVISARQIAAAPRKVRGTGTIPKGSGLKPKDLVGIPWLVAFALRAAGWWLRCDIIWSKPNCMPLSVKDRPTTSHEYLFLLSKSARYFYDAEAIKEPDKGMKAGNREGFKGRQGTAGYHVKSGGEGGKAWVVGTGRNKRSVWTVSKSSYKGAHFATYPPKLIRPCILAGSRPGDTVLDPFNGAGTTGLVAMGLGRKYIGIDINPEYLELTRKRLAEVPVELFKRGCS